MLSSLRIGVRLRILVIIQCLLMIAVGLTGCASPDPNKKPFTPIGPAPLSPRPDQGFPVAPGSPTPNFPNPRDSSGLSQPNLSGSNNTPLNSPPTTSMLANKP